MYRQLFHLGLACAIAAASLGVGLAQEKEKDVEDYRRFFRKPENALEFYKAIQFELEVGRPDLAAKHLRGLQTLLAAKPGEKERDKELLTVVDSVGLTPIVRLRNVRVWSKDPKEEKQAHDDVRQFVRQASEASARRLKDPARLRGFIAQLRATPEEKTYAIRELYKSGSAAMPELINALGKATDATDRLAILDAIESMGPNAVAPMIAALDSDNARLKLDLLDILRKKHARDAAQIAPHLIFPSANKAEDKLVREKARELLADFLDVPASRLTPAKVALTREAEKFYQRQAALGDPKAVAVWRWDGERVVQGWPGAATITAEQANEYWGLRFARQALTLDPSYRPAQLVFLGLAIQSRPGPEVAELVSKSSTELLIELLERALKEQRSPEAIAAIRALGNRAEVRAKKGADPALVRALYYPDPRVQMEAVETLLLIPGPPAPKTSARIVELLGRQLTPLSVHRPGRRILVAITEEDFRTKVRDAVEKAGADPVAVGNGRDAMRQLRGRADIDAILLDSTLPYPGLAHLLAQMRADVDVGRVPILLAAIPETRTAHDLAAAFRVIEKRLEYITYETRSYRGILREIDEEEAAALKAIGQTKFLRSEERIDAERVARAKFEQERKQLDQKYLDASRLSKDVSKLGLKKDRLAEKYDLESRVREGQLERFTARYQNVRVVHPSTLTDGKSLESTLTAAIREANVALTPVQREQNAEVAIAILSNLAQGKPAGYDIRPAADSILAALRAGKLSPRGQVAAIDAAARLPGSRPQVELVNAMLDAARPVNVRTAAGEGLVQSIQRHGVLLTAQQVAPVHELAREAKLDAGLKGQVNTVLGALRPGDRKTGETLRRYNPAPVAPLPPPKDKDDKEEKKDDKKDEKKDKDDKKDKEKDKGID